MALLVLQLLLDMRDSSSLLGCARVPAFFKRKGRGVLLLVE